MTMNSTEPRHRPTERPVLRASATISASRGPAPSALFMYIQVPSTSSSSPISSITMPGSRLVICGIQSSQSSASMNTAHRMMLMIVPKPKLSPHSTAAMIAAAPTIMDAVP